MNIERKSFTGLMTKADDERGIIDCIFAVFGNVDHGKDRIWSGSFKKTIKERGDEVLVLDMHNSSSIFSALGVPLSLEEVGRQSLPDDIKAKYPEATGGVKASVQFLMDTPEGRGAYIRLKTRAVQKWSFGYEVMDSDYSNEKLDGKHQTRVRNLRQLKLYELSPVIFAMNDATSTTGVKSSKDGDVVIDGKTVISFQDFELAGRDVAWDGPEAELRVRAWAGGSMDGGEGVDWAKYAQAFLWHSDDDDEAQKLSGYKLGYVDIIDGQPKAVPRALFTIAAVLQGARGGVDVSEADQAKLRTHVERYYKQMAVEFEDESIVVPWADDEKSDSPTLAELLPQLTDMVAKASELMGEVKGVHTVRYIDYLTGHLHLKATGISDSLFIDGFMNYDERKATSHALGVALDSLMTNIPLDLQDRELPDYYYPYGYMSRDGDAVEVNAALALADGAKAGRVLSARNAEALAAASASMMAAFVNLEKILLAAGVIDKLTIEELEESADPESEAEKALNLAALDVLLDHESILHLAGLVEKATKLSPNLTKSDADAGPEANSLPPTSEEDPAGPPNAPTGVKEDTGTHERLLQLLELEQTEIDNINLTNPED